MQIKIKKVSDSVTQSIDSIIRAIDKNGRKKILQYGADIFIKMTKANFGSSGRYRDEKWPPLSKAYAKKVGRSYATLKVSGNLYNSIKVGRRSSNFIEILTENPYAAAHTFGSKTMKKRNFWPVEFSKGNPSLSRLLYPAEREFVIAITRRLTLLSGGALPTYNDTIKRSEMTYGNPFSPAQQSIV